MTKNNINSNTKVLFIDPKCALELLYFTKPVYSKEQISTRNDKFAKT